MNRPVKPQSRPFRAELKEIFKKVDRCGVCLKGPLEIIWDLPRLPLTEKYGTYQPHHSLYADQALLLCSCCGHVQLGRQMSPQLLYTACEYSFRTSQSATARQGTEYFFQFFHDVAKGSSFQSLLDIGGNDLFLAEMTQAKDRCVIDPVCESRETRGIRVIGTFIEEVDFQKEKLHPDLIFCRHVLEHIANPRELLESLFQKSASNALYIFEIPCFENLVEAYRFDAIFHQHYHYFDLASFQRLIVEAGGEYIDHRYNRQGSCGGALLIAFRKALGKKRDLPSVDTAARVKEIRLSIAKYQAQMAILSGELKKFSQAVYGYGASLMLSTLAYHLKTDLSELICVLDDDIQKEGWEYQNVPVKIRYRKNLPLEKNGIYLITSLENSRKILQQVTALSPRRILTPLVI